MLYLMRHGRTDWNVQRKLQGKTDIPLNEEGCMQAKEAHDRYRDLQFDLVYVSPLCRAKETAEIFLGDRKLEMIEDERLRNASTNRDSLIYKSSIEKL